MIQTGADIQSAIIMKEIELRAGKNVKQGIGPAVKKLQTPKKRHAGTGNR